jgi:uncharacterized protein (TIGR00255 family)
MSEILTQPMATKSSVRSMTGQGAGSVQDEIGTVAVELRSVNQRGIRLLTKMSDALSPMEGQFEQLIRSQVKRGSIQASARYAPSTAVPPGSINGAAVVAYATQLHHIRDSLMISDPIDLAGLLQLPGVITYGEGASVDPEALWVMLREATLVALNGLDAMRADEGEAMADQLRADAGLISGYLERIAALAPRVVDQYRDRLEGRVKRFLQERGLEVAAVDILREVQLFADRSDISEEITRLSSHLRMFGDALGGDDASGRKLDFIIQEMFRETNTIGSKAGDAEIGSMVVEIKCAIERMRELVQNLE